MNAVRTWVVAATGLVLSAGALIAHAQAPPSASRVVVRQTSPRRIELSLDQAVRLAQHRYKARVVRAETQIQGGRTIYILRMLDESGRVFAVRVDAESGAIL
jgi:uncharacterized membrane protein YkoI